MPFIIGTSVIILAIVLIGLVASRKFARLAEIKGYEAGKAKRYPWVIAAATFSLMLMGQTILSFFANAYILLGWSAFTLLLMITVLRKAYKNMLQAPDSGEITQAIEVEKAEVEPMEIFPTGKD